MKDKIENIVKAADSKENEINAELRDDFELAIIWDGYSVENLKNLSVEAEKSEDASTLKEMHSQLVALQGVKAKAYASLAELQDAYE